LKRYKLDVMAVLMYYLSVGHEPTKKFIFLVLIEELT